MWRPLLVSLLVAASLAVPAEAHLGDPNAFSVIDAVEPAVPGITVEVRVGVTDQLLLVNTTDAPVEVLDREGEPFLRVGPKVVEADYSRADWYQTNSPLGLAAPPKPANGPEWRVVARGSSWGWFDHRLHEESYTPPKDPQRNARLAEWTIPLRHKGAAIAVRGHLEYRPVPGTFRTRLAKIPGTMSFQTFDGRVPGIFLGWSEPETLTVYGVEGEPFLRYGPKGLERNEASPTHQDDLRLRGDQPTGVVDLAKPRWKVVGPRRMPVSWLDRRLAYAPGVPPPDVLRARKEAVVVEWEIPVDIGGVRDSVRGVTEWVPRQGAGTARLPRWLTLVPAVVGAVLGVGLVHLRRRLRGRERAPAR
ncbi:MAG TPA: hypothetical protein VNQ77_03085 [Frankiaceae bacterium]|nr:hypothetical protein [Frankiaceae bacterium]